MLRSDRLSQDDGLHPVRRLSPEGLEALWQPIQHDSSCPHLPISHSHSWRVCGLRPATSWLLCIIAILIIGGAIGGGVAGVLANKKMFSGSSRYVNSRFPTRCSAPISLFKARVQILLPRLRLRRLQYHPQAHLPSHSQLSRQLRYLPRSLRAQPAYPKILVLRPIKPPMRLQLVACSHFSAVSTGTRGILFQTDRELFWTWDILCSILLVAALKLACPTTKIPEAIRIHAKLSLTSRI
jgi:hypothetical protein